MYMVMFLNQYNSLTPPLKSVLHKVNSLQDKLAETHDIGEVNQKGLIFKNPTTDSPTYTPHTNGSVPHLDHNKSRDLHTPPTAVVTQETVQIELCETETKQCSDTDNMLTTVSVQLNHVTNALAALFISKQALHVRIPSILAVNFEPFKLL